MRLAGKEWTALKKVAGALCLLLMLGFFGHWLPAVTAAGADAAASPAEEPVRVACVGDMITVCGEDGYAAHLQTLLGDGYDVENFGWEDGMISQGVEEWQRSEAFYRSALFAPEIVLLMVGTADGISDSFGDTRTYFKRELKKLIALYESFENAPRVYVLTSPYVYSLPTGDPDTVNIAVRELQLVAAREAGVKSIDLNALTRDVPECFPDGVRPNESGNLLIAQQIYKKVFSGKLSTLTLHTAAGATVQIGDALREADASGTVELEMLPGAYRLVLSREGCKTIIGTLEIPEGESVCNCPMELGGTNMAVGRPVSASSSFGEAASSVVDGREEGGWTPGVLAPQWISVDLGRVMTIGAVQVHWGARYATHFRIEVSEDGQRWRQVAVRQLGQGGVELVPFAALEARYVRLTIVQFAEAEDDTAVAELQVLRSDGTDLVQVGARYAATPLDEPPTDIKDTVYGKSAAIAGLVIFVIVIVVAYRVLKGHKKQQQPK